MDHDRDTTATFEDQMAANLDNIAKADMPETFRGWLQELGAAISKLYYLHLVDDDLEGDVLHCAFNVLVDATNHAAHLVQQGTDATKMRDQGIPVKVIGTLHTPTTTPRERTEWEAYVDNLVHNIHQLLEPAFVREIEEATQENVEGDGFAVKSVYPASIKTNSCFLTDITIPAPCRSFLSSRPA